jgi:modulator of FtsH protease
MRGGQVDAAYDSETWQTFYATIAGAAAALMGPLFVALSPHLRAIATNTASRGRARETLGSFLSLLVIAILVLIPAQGR